MASSKSPAPFMPGRIVIACDSTKNPSAKELEHIISNIQMRKEMIQEVDTITVLGVLHKVLHPMGFQIQIGPDSFIGTRVRAIKEEVSRMVDAYLGKLQHSAEKCEGSGVVIEVKIVVGAPLKEVIVQEAVASNATWVVLNRHLKKELRFYLKHIPCKVAVTLDNFSLKVLRPSYSDKAAATDSIEYKLFYTLSKLVPLIPAEYYPIYHGSNSSQGSSGSDKSSFASSVTSKSKDQNIFSPEEFVSNSHPEKPDIYAKGTDKYDNPPPVKLKQSDAGFSVPCTANEINSKLNTKESKYLEIQIVANTSLSGDLSREDTDDKVATESDDSCPTIQKHRNLQLEFHEMKMQLDWKGWNYSEIQTATNDFSCDNLVREDEYGFVYKGRLKDGHVIAVKVVKDVNKRGFSEFHSQLCALSLACHKNVSMLLGYCHRENTNILVYEYTCNRSLEWHLFDNTEGVLEWHQRHAIAVGIAKGLRFLHEECRGSPIVHSDMKLTNIFLTHELVPLLADCGLAKWKMNKHGDSEYVAPEYAENGVCSVKTDVFAFGIILIQLISGRRGVDRVWAMQLIMGLKLDELVDPRLGDSYGMYELYQMSRVACLCLENKSSIRPTVGEVLLILEGENDRLHRHTIKNATI